MAKQNVTDSARAGADFPFTSQQYRWLGVGLGLLVVGYLLMSGGASDDPEVFSDAIFNTRRITVAPTVVLAGYATILYAILKRG
jgi:hypothetical protein